jgi:hypothetical protein
LARALAARRSPLAYLTAFGVLKTAGIKRFQAFMALTQLLVNAAVLPFRSAVAAERPARVAERADPDWPLACIVGAMRHVCSAS